MVDTENVPKVSAEKKVLLSDSALKDFSSDLNSSDVLAAVLSVSSSGSSLLSSVCCMWRRLSLLIVAVLVLFSVAQQTKSLASTTIAIMKVSMGKINFLFMFILLCTDLVCISFVTTKL